MQGMLRCGDDEEIYRQTWRRVACGGRAVNGDLADLMLRSQRHRFFTLLQYSIHHWTLPLFSSSITDSTR